MAKGISASSPITLAVIITLYMVSLGVMVRYDFLMAATFAPTLYIVSLGVIVC